MHTTRIVGSRLGRLGGLLAVVAVAASSLTGCNVYDASNVTPGWWNSTCAVTAGQVRCWGNTYYGDGSARGYSLPVGPAAEGISDAVQVVAGYAHVCALMGDGTVRCWGDNQSRQLGDGTSDEHRSPVTVPGLEGVVQITTSESTTCARLVDGTVECWGSNTFGQVGDGTPGGARRSPTAALGITTAADVSTDGMTTCAALTDGTVSCWGFDDHYQLGNQDGTNYDQPTPAAVHGLSGIVQVSVVSKLLCALDTAGAVWCWGDGRVLDPPTATDDSPVAVPGATGAIAIAGPCLLTDAGTVKCWGHNNGGEVGDGTTTRRDEATAVVGLAGVDSIGAGLLHRCAVLDTAEIRCWGYNASRQLGADTPTVAQSTPVAVVYGPGS